MNTFVQAQIYNMKSMVKTFEKACEMAMLKDDGKIDNEEAKALKRIRAASAAYIKELEKI